MKYGYLILAILWWLGSVGMFITSWRAQQNGIWIDLHYMYLGNGVGVMSPGQGYCVSITEAFAGCFAFKCYKNALRR